MKKAKIKCRLCGYEFKVPIEEDVGHPVGPKICPNCGHTA
jgi:rubredoxin